MVELKVGGFPLPQNPPGLHHTNLGRGDGCDVSTTEIPMLECFKIKNCHLRYA